MTQRVLIWILGDQLLKQHPALEHALTVTDRDSVRIVLIESAARLQRLAYQRKKLVLLVSAMRHYAAMLRDQGYDAACVWAETTAAGLRACAADFRPEACVTMAASEYGGRDFQQSRLAAVVGCPVTVVPNTQFMVGRYDPFPDVPDDKRVVMETFYRRMRQHFDLLMDGNDPAGGSWNYDKENRKPLPKNAAPPPIDGFAPDEITQDVMTVIKPFKHGVGTVEGFNYAVTHEQAEQALEQFIKERLGDFGAYEDAMSHDHGKLWHSILSPYLNIGLLEPIATVERVIAAYRAGDVPINSVEGFVRQVIGWREFMYWQYWRLMPELAEANHWGATRPMPMMFWDGGQTEMNCISQIVKRVTDSGYNHHIERLMVVTNFATLAGIEPQAVVGWMKAFYIDAYDWVMQTNVIGMGLNADGGIIATKPYIASANYINKMGDFCKSCRFNPRKRHGEDACPFNALYWSFLITHEEALRKNPRSGKAVLGLRHLDEGEREAVQAAAEAFLESLGYYWGAQMD